ncbi:MAG: Abi family protein [Flavobacteriales bacterium]|nr:Abi family protein [Flavobacteriales bacterium]MCB9198739.1 Abi family protein [Flavobacteriales bacterium]
MGRIATSTNEQIELLKSRGMILDLDEVKVKELLHDIGYYRLGFYWHPFEKDKDHNFIDNTKFSSVVALYYLDVDLRNLLVRALYRIEVNFRSNVVYYVSNTYKNSPTWFIDTHVVDQSFINEIGNHYNDKFKKDNKVIQCHHNKYINDKFAPAWKTLEFFTFGAILKLYSSLKSNETQQRISLKYDVRNTDKFKNLINTIVFVRNACAHGGVIFDLKTSKGISKMPQFDFHNENRHSLDSAIRVIQFILQQISINRKNELETDIKNLFESHRNTPEIKKIIEEKIGYHYN